MSTAEQRRRVTSADVARAVGVSRATVGFVLNDTPGQAISEGTRQRVLEAALSLGYRPNSAARALARGRTDIVVLVLPDWPVNEIMTAFLEKTAEILDAAGYCQVIWTNRRHHTSRPLWELLDADLVMGFSLFDEDQVAVLEASGVPKVFPRAGQKVDGSGYIDATRLQVAHLHELGHRRLAFARPADARLAFLEQWRLDVVQAEAARREVRIVDARVADHRDGSAEHAVRAWQEAGCTGVVAYNDEVAAAVVSAALRCGISVPRQLSVIGHDDSTLAGLFAPTLTSVRIDVDAMAHSLAAAALRELGAPLATPVPVATPTVQHRESTAPPTS